MSQLPLSQNRDETFVVVDHRSLQR